MLNRERVILMTRMASYEAGEGKKNLNVTRYFRGDYIWVQMIKAFLSATISALLVLALYIYYNFETFMENIYEIDLLAFGKQVGYYYLWFVGIYLIIVYLVCNIKYGKAWKNLRRYSSNLKKLGNMYKRD